MKVVLSPITFDWLKFKKKLNKVFDKHGVPVFKPEMLSIHNRIRKDIVNEIMTLTRLCIKEVNS